MNALRLGLIASLLAFATAHAVGDEMPVETIVVTAKRPTFMVSGGTLLIVTVRAPARATPEIVAVSPEDGVVIEPPAPLIETPRIETPRIEWPKFTITPQRIQLALADPAQDQG
jgi:hypothetical protein